LDSPGQFGAAASAAGYLYQVRLGLALALPLVNASTGIEISVELLDDVAFEREGSPVELLQTKHHLGRTASLTDSSSDLWKTIRVWAAQIADDPSLPTRCRLVLLTTGTAPAGSAASWLRPTVGLPPDQRRDPNEALRLLTEVAGNSLNQALTPAFDAFLALTPEMRASLLTSIEVLDGQPTLGDIEAVLDQQLRLVAPRGKAAVARELLEGWWWPRVCRALMSQPPGRIAITDLETKLEEVREWFRRDALPITFADAVPSTEEAAGYEAFTFVRQLQGIGIGRQRITNAKRDYYRAFAQRSQWLRDHLTLDDEVASFEATLTEEWEARFEAMCDDCADAACEAETLQAAGATIYRWVEAEARFPFRGADARFLCVGSYHILADHLRVGWHRDFRTMFNDDDA
jgi:hypothetical protein